MGIDQQKQLKPRVERISLISIITEYVRSNIHDIVSSSRYSREYPIIVIYNNLAMI